MSKNTISTLSVAMKPHIALTRKTLNELCSEENWHMAQKYLQENPYLSTEELAASLKTTIYTLIKTSSKCQLFCLFNLSQRLTGTEPPIGFDKIIIDNKNSKLSALLCSQNNTYLLQTIIDVKNFLIDESIYILLRHTRSYDSFELLLRNTTPEYIIRYESKYRTCHAIKGNGNFTYDYHRSLLHIVTTSCSTQIFKLLIAVPGLDLYIQDDNGKTIFDILRQNTTYRATYTEKSQFLESVINRNEHIDNITNNNQVVYTIHDFKPEDLNWLTPDNIMTFFSQDSNFDNRLYNTQNQQGKKTVTQHVMSLMRYDLMAAILKYRNEIPTISSVKSLIMREGVNEHSSIHNVYKANIKKFLQLVIQHNDKIFFDLWALATQQNNTIAINALSELMSQDINQLNMQSLISNYTSYLNQLCIDHNWQEIDKYLKESHTEIDTLTLITSLRTVMSDRFNVHNCRDELSFLINITEILKNRQTPDEFTPVSVPNNYNILELLCLTTHRNVLQHIIDAKVFFSDETMYILLRQAKDCETFQLLIPHVDVQYINKQKYFGAAKKTMTPLLHIIALSHSYKMFESLLKIPNLDLHIEHNGKTASILLSDRIASNNIARTELSKSGSKYQLLQKIIACNELHTNVSDHNQWLDTLQHAITIQTQKDPKQFDINNLNNLTPAEIVVFLNQDNNFANKTYPLENAEHSETIAQRIVSLMRYDLLSAILTHTGKMPPSISINDVIMHKDANQYSLQHNFYQENLQKILQLFIRYNRSNIMKGWKLAIEAHNITALEYLSDYITPEIETHLLQMQIVNQNNELYKLCTKKQWIKANDYLKTHTVSFADLVENLAIIFQHKKWPDGLQGCTAAMCINIISKEILLAPSLQNFIPISVTQQKLELLTNDETYTYCIENIINIKYIFSNDLLHSLLKESITSINAFNILIKYIDIHWINKTNDVPFLHKVILHGSKEVFQKLVNIDGIDLKIVDKTNKNTPKDLISMRIALSKTFLKNHPNNSESLLTLHTLEQKLILLENALVLQSQETTHLEESKKRQNTNDVESDHITKKLKSNENDTSQEDHCIQIDNLFRNESQSLVDQDFELYTEFNLLLGNVI